MSIKLEYLRAQLGNVWQEFSFAYMNATRPFDSFLAERHLRWPIMVGINGRHGTGYV